VYVGGRKPASRSSILPRSKGGGIREERSFLPKVSLKGSLLPLGKGASRPRGSSAQKKGLCVARKESMTSETSPRKRDLRASMGRVNPARNLHKKGKKQRIAEDLRGERASAKTPLKKKETRDRPCPGVKKKD